MRRFPATRRAHKIRRATVVVVYTIRCATCSGHRTLPCIIFCWRSSPQLDFSSNFLFPQPPRVPKSCAWLTSLPASTTHRSRERSSPAFLAIPLRNVQSHAFASDRGFEVLNTKALVSGHRRDIHETHRGILQARTEPVRPKLKKSRQV